MSKIKDMKLRYKVVAGVATGAAVLGMAGGAFAYFTTGGSNTGSATAGSAGSWAVASVTANDANLYPNQGSTTVSAVVQNTTGSGYQGLNNLKVQITGVAENSPGNGSAFANEAPCSIADYQLASTNAGWAVSKSADNNDTANFALGTVAEIAPGHYAVTTTSAAPADSSGTGNALPTGLTLKMIDNNAPQDQCQGATVTLTVSAS